MSTPSQGNEAEARAAAEAAAWMSRLDRGLTANEQDEFFSWLAASPVHSEALQRCRRRWRRLDRLADWRPECGVAPNPDLLAPRRSAAWRPWGLLALGAAAGLALVVTVSWRPSADSPEPATTAAVPRAEDRRLLPDQSVMKVNDGAAPEVLYTPAERRVRLSRGEVFFKVARNPDRPFVVDVGGATIRALGTAFNVRLAGGELEVLVAEGRVEIARPTTAPAATGGAPAPDTTVLAASQRMSVALDATRGAGQVATLTRREIQQTLAWQHGLMTFQDQPLAGIVDELNRLNDRQIVLADPALADLRFSGTIRSDNLDGFVRLLVTSFGAEVVPGTGEEIRVRMRGTPR